MIPNAVDVVSVKNNIDMDDTGQFTVDENSLAKIMSVLTNLYSDPEGAVVREYLTNALDAQIEAQQADDSYVWRPIEVSLPSHFSKAYVVRDFGIGMSVDDIKNIYSKYGKSTKESSNAVTGMLGLGSKCALTYTSQFTITGIKNGMMTKAIVTKDEADIPTFMIVDTRATTEPNGVEISVPVRDRNSFEAKTRHFLSFWKDGQVLVNGREPDKISHKEVKPGVFLVKNPNGYGSVQSYVVMGNVPYSVDYEFVDNDLSAAGFGYVAYVPMGAIDFPPSRERLMMTTRTKKVVKDVSEGLWTQIVKEALKEVSDAPDHKSAFVAYLGLNNNVRNHKLAVNLTYKGDKFPHRGYNGAFAHDHMRLTWSYDGHGYLTNLGRMNSDYITSDALVVTGVDQKSKPTSYFKKKVKQYQQDNNLPTDDALLVLNDFQNPWFDHLPRVDMDTIKKVKLPTNGGGAPRVDAPYDFMYVDDAGVRVDGSEVTPVFPKGYTVAYITPTDIRETYRKRGTSSYSVLSHLGSKVVLVVMGKNRFDKFLRTFPDAVPASKVIQERVNTLSKSTNSMQFAVQDLDGQIKSYLANAKVADLVDPDLVEMAKAVQGIKPGMKSDYEVAVEICQWAPRASMRITQPTPANDGADKAERLAERYPLIAGYYGDDNVGHLTYYANAVYAAEHAGKP